VDGDNRHLPRAAAIEAYGKGGFAFAGMSHRGSLLCLPDGVWASAVTTAADIDANVLQCIFDCQATIEHCLIGTGVDMVPLAASLRHLFRDRRIAVEVMTTGAAISTYNILLGEGRAIAALLIAVA
jgi:uncharacterized protein